MGRNERILADVRAGWTYTDAARRNGVTRNVVAGVVARNKMPVRYPKVRIANSARWMRQPAEALRAHARRMAQARWSKAIES